jgi:hypothetical protein
MPRHRCSRIEPDACPILGTQAVNTGRCCDQSYGLERIRGRSEPWLDTHAQSINTVPKLTVGFDFPHPLQARALLNEVSDQGLFIGPNVAASRARYVSALRSRPIFALTHRDVYTNRQRQ